MAKRKSEKTALPREISTGDLARLVGCSTRRIAQLVEENVLERTRHGAFDASQAVQAFMNHRVRLAEKAATKAIAAAEGSREYDQAKASWMIEKANTARIAREQREGELIDVEEVEAVEGALFSNFRTHLLAVPSRVAARWPTIRTAQEAELLVSNEITGAMVEFTNREIRIAGDDGDAPPA